MDKNLAIQYTAVGIIIIAALVWLVIKFNRQRKNKGSSSCCGCALSGKCASGNDIEKNNEKCCDSCS